MRLNSKRERFSTIILKYIHLDASNTNHPRLYKFQIHFDQLIYDDRAICSESKHILHILNFILDFGGFLAFI
jgi:hypothetical protein